MVERYRPKSFKQRRPDGGRSLKGVRRVLYRLPGVIEAVAAGEVVYVVEGEKDVEAVRRAGGVATCHAGGTGGIGQWERGDFTMPLYGAEVVIVAYADRAGYQCARAIETALAGLAAGVRVVQAARGQDAYDHLAAGFGLAQFVDVREPPAENGRLADRRVDLVDLLSRPAREVPWRVENVVADGTLTVIAGQADVGKSFLAIGACLEVYHGGWLIDAPCTRGRRCTSMPRWVPTCSRTASGSPAPRRVGEVIPRLDGGPGPGRRAARLWEDAQGLRLRCREGGTMRYAAKPEDVWLALDPFAGGVTAAVPGAALPPAPKAPRRDEVERGVLAALPARKGEPRSGSGVISRAELAAEATARTWPVPRS